MPKRNESITLDEYRRKTNERQRKFYKNNKERLSKEALERYYTKKMLQMQSN